MLQNSFINWGSLFVLLVTDNDNMIVYWIVSHLFLLNEAVFLMLNMFLLSDNFFWKDSLIVVSLVQPD